MAAKNRFPYLLEGFARANQRLPIKGLQTNRPADKGKPVNMDRGKGVNRRLFSLFQLDFFGSFHIDGGTIEGSFQTTINL